MVIILSVIRLIVRVIIVVNFQFIVKSLLVFIVIVLTVNNWVNTGDVFWRLQFFCIRVNVVVVVIAVKCLIYLWNCKMFIFFWPNVICSAYNEEPPQPVLWLIFNRNISKNNNCFNIEIAKSIPHIVIVTNYAKTC